MAQADATFPHPTAWAPVSQLHKQGEHLLPRHDKDMVLYSRFVPGELGFANPGPKGALTCSVKSVAWPWLWDEKYQPTWHESLVMSPGLQNCSPRKTAPLARLLSCNSAQLSHPSGYPLLFAALGLGKVAAQMSYPTRCLAQPLLRHLLSLMSFSSSLSAPEPLTWASQQADWLPRDACGRESVPSKTFLTVLCPERGFRF